MACRLDIKSIHEKSGLKFLKIIEQNSRQFFFLFVWCLLNCLIELFIKGGGGGGGVPSILYLDHVICSIQHNWKVLKPNQVYT